MSDKQLNEEFKKLEAQIRKGTQFGGGDSRAILGVALLGQAIVNLDRTSTRLAVVNVILAVILAAIGVMQICLMLHGH